MSTALPSPSPAAPQQRSSVVLPITPIVMSVLVAICAGSWWAMVLHPQQESEARAREADAFEAQAARARAYLSARLPSEVAKAEIDAAAEKLHQLIPDGRKDIALTTLLQDAATTAGLSEFHYDVTGGMALPKDEPERPAEKRLALDPQQLMAQVVTVDFSGSYEGYVKFEKAVSRAPWMLEWMQASLRKGKDQTVEGRITLRYFYQ